VKPALTLIKGGKPSAQKCTGIGRRWAKDLARTLARRDVSAMMNTKEMSRDASSPNG
jgi:hypothetical protein